MKNLRISFLLVFTFSFISQTCFAQKQSNGLSEFSGLYVGDIATNRHMRKTKLFLYPGANGNISGLVSKRITSGAILIQFEGTYKLASKCIHVDVTKNYKVDKQGQRTGSISQSLATLDFSICQGESKDEYTLANKARWYLRTNPKKYVEYKIKKKLDPSNLLAAIKTENSSVLKKEIKELRKKNFRMDLLYTDSGFTLLEQAMRNGSLKMTQTLLDAGLPPNAQNFKALKENVTSNQILQFVEQIKQTRVSYDKLMDRLNQNQYQPTWQEFEQLRVQGQSQFSTLVPKQIQSLQKKIESFASQSAYNELLNLLNRDLSNNKNEYEKGLKITKFVDQYYPIYEELKDDHITKLRAKLDTLLIASLSTQMQEERKFLSELPDELNSIAILNKQYRVFDSKFDIYPQEQLIKETIKEYRLKKSKLLVRLENQITQLFQEASNLKALEKEKQIYLTRIGKHSAIGRLKNVYSQRKKEIQESDRKLAIQKKAEAERVQKLELAEAKRLRKVKAAKEYKRALTSSKRTISSSEVAGIISRLRKSTKQGFTYYNNEDMNVNNLFKSYLMNLSKNELYVHNQLRSQTREIKSRKLSSGKVAFTTNQDLNGFFNYTTGEMQYSYAIEVRTIIDTEAWRIAQRCSSVKRILQEPVETYFKVIGVSIDDATGIPVLFHTSLSNEICGQIAVYDNCRTPCHTILRKGSNNFNIYITKELQQYFD